MRVHQILSGAGPFDAVTSQALAYRELFARWGMEGGVHAFATHPHIRSRVRPLERLRPERGDLLLFHYSAHAPRLEALLDLPQRKLLVYHNVTPARYLWAANPHVAVLCELGRGRLPLWVGAVDVACAVSGYNARELAEAGADEPRVVPILFDRARHEPRSSAPGDGDGPLVIAVGRLAPHKRPDLVVRAFALYQRHCEPRARLLCAGEPLDAGYRRELEELVRTTGARDVLMPGGVAQRPLNGAYAAASALLSLSEHEGFCIPLLEAFHHRVPVLARPVGGMPEVGGDAVLWIDEPDLPTIAELLHLAVTDGELRDELSGRAAGRLEEYSYERTAELIREAVEAALSGRSSAAPQPESAPLV